MIFSELYSAYYNTVASILKAAVDHPLQKNELRRIIREHAFGESVLKIEPALSEERWQLIRADGTTPLKHAPSMPLTLLQKRWLKAISSDPRMALFGDAVPDFPDVEPLFTPEDVLVFDKYSDGDPYEDETYQRNFRVILSAIRERYPLSIKTENRRGGTVRLVLLPEYLEYSEKDDKFRLIGSGRRRGGTVNLARITSCEPYTEPYEFHLNKKTPQRSKTVEFELIDERNALERVLLHFAHFEKQAERLTEDRYRVTVTYDKDDETELLIRLLSFGPMLKVTAPQSFVELVKKRLLQQKSCEQ